MTTEGLPEAFAGVEVVVHCASSPSRPKHVDVVGTQHLLAAATSAGVRHLIYPSIVGIERNQGFPLYRAKLAAEQLIAEGAVSSTIQRATQFHELVRALVRGLDRLPRVLLVPSGIRLQPVSSADVADRLAELVAAPPAGRVADLGGPDEHSLAELALAYLDHAGRDKRVVEVPVPGSVSRAFRSGAQVPRGGLRAATTWEQFLSAG